MLGEMRHWMDLWRIYIYSMMRPWNQGEAAIRAVMFSMLCKKIKLVVYYICWSLLVRLIVSKRWQVYSWTKMCTVLRLLKLKYIELHINLPQTCLQLKTLLILNLFLTSLWAISIQSTVLFKSYGHIILWIRK